MKKIRLFFNYSILLIFCQLVICFSPVLAISKVQKDSIIDNCTNIKENLKNIQKSDARTRIYLGGHYEAVLSKFVIPLNIKLVEKNISSVGLIENQKSLAGMKANFSNDFIKYQQLLEELVTKDCKTEPEGFYNKLVSVREAREVVRRDVAKMRGLISEHIKLVNGLKGEL